MMLICGWKYYFIRVFYRELFISCEKQYKSLSNSSIGPHIFYSFVLEVTTLHKTFQVLNSTRQLITWLIRAEVIYFFLFQFTILNQLWTTFNPQCIQACNTIHWRTQPDKVRWALRGWNESIPKYKYIFHLYTSLTRKI